MPGDVVYEGFLGPPPSTHRSTPENLSMNQVLLQGRNNNILLSGLHFAGNHRHANIQEYRCFIKTTDGTIYKADLEPYHSENLTHVSNRVFVRLPIPGHPVYTGVLNINVGYEPIWLFFIH